MLAQKRTFAISANGVTIVNATPSDETTSHRVAEVHVAGSVYTVQMYRDNHGVYGYITCCGAPKFAPRSYAHHEQTYADYLRWVVGLVLTAEAASSGA